eukprot:CAMPEP_0115013170 /NCGR_PEP_ID=MMETSP0216-20121206/25232_1 /TAXON_ID=223996 /ORGANISM="Protocruzia adherens, Strain Boccale" /LENGTH=324 /DNA_ID=CAMNT_0002382485 /DNA_START=227 /DNA_END=1201 /DNA_ORIENTATION=+
MVSRLLDIGSGFGKPVFHGCLQSGCEGKGIEVVPSRVEASVDLCYSLQEEFLKKFAKKQGTESISSEGKADSGVESKDETSTADPEVESLEQDKISSPDTKSEANEDLKSNAPQADLSSSEETELKTESPDMKLSEDTLLREEVSKNATTASFLDVDTFKGKRGRPKKRKGPTGGSRQAGAKKKQKTEGEDECVEETKLTDQNCEESKEMETTSQTSVFDRYDPISWLSRISFEASDATKFKIFHNSSKDHFSHIYSYDKLMGEECHESLSKILNRTNFKVVIWYFDPKKSERFGLKNVKLVHKMSMTTTGHQNFTAYVYIKTP